MTADDVIKRDFLNSQLNDTRYIARVALEYLATLGCDVSTSKGVTTSWLRHQWDLNSLLGASSLKERTDHRHHLIDAAVVACVDRGFYKTLVGLAKSLERTRSDLTMNDLHTDAPWDAFREDLRGQLDSVIVSHDPQRKITGALHEETGVGFLEGLGNVYRLALTPDFKATQVDKIIDPAVRECVRAHLAAHGDDPKTAFAPEQTVFHRNGKTPIKRVRVLQSKTTLAKLQKAKFGVKDQTGEVFKWHAYGNLHHVEVLREKSSGNISGIFVTMMEAAHRVHGIGGAKRPVIQTDHGPDYDFVMSLARDELVSVPSEGKERLYRVQKLKSGNNAVVLRLHTASTLTNSEETLPIGRSTIKNLIEVGAKKIEVNSIGKII
jgi:CRISPR-associated endonuclease Csn1